MSPGTILTLFNIKILNILILIMLTYAHTHHNIMHIIHTHFNIIIYNMLYNIQYAHAYATQTHIKYTQRQRHSYRKITFGTIKNVHTILCTYAHITHANHIHTHTRTHTHTLTCTSTHICIQTRTHYTCKHTYTHTRTHTHTHTDMH